MNEDLIKTCCSYIEEQIQIYIDNFIDKITMEIINSHFLGKMNEFIKLADVDDGKKAYKKILDELAIEIFDDFCVDKPIEDNKELRMKVFEILYDDISFYGNELCKKMKLFAKENINNPDYNHFLDAKAISELEDKVGDKFFNLVSRDYDKRDLCFIDINGEIFVSDGGQTHAQLVNSYLESIEKDKLRNKHNRPGNAIMNEFADKFGFGEIEYGVWFVEDTDYYGNMSSGEIVDDIKKSKYKPDKIYICTDNGRLTRAAKFEVK